MSIDLLDRTLIICDPPVHHDSGAMVREQVMATMLREHSDGPALLADESEGIGELNERPVYEFNTESLNWEAHMPCRIFADIRLRASQVSRKFRRPIGRKLSGERGNRKHAV